MISAARGIIFHCTIFLRNDIYDILLSETSDRGKETRVLVDWSQTALLKQMVRRRFQYALNDTQNSSVEALWYQLCVAIVEQENSLDYLVRHSLMRPRYLLRLINHCIGNAINYERDKADEYDILEGISAYSTDVVKEIDLEIRDIVGQVDVLYTFLGEPREMNLSVIRTLITKKIPDESNASAVYSLLIWHGVLGFKRGNQGYATYIYDVNYDMKRFLGLIDKEVDGDPTMQLNPAFWAGLELTA